MPGRPSLRWNTGTALVRPSAAVWPDVVSHGFYITAANTGHTYYYDSSLGRFVVDGDLAVSSGAVAVSDFVGNGGTITKRWFQAGIDMDRNNVTFVACKFNQGVSGFYSGTSHPFTLNWCTIDTPGAAGDDGIYYDSWTAYRCRIGGHSDGGKVNGLCTVTECYIRTEQQTVDDHNDGLQNSGGAGNNVITRCNINGTPVGGTIYGTSALMCADGATGLMTYTDNFLAGGGVTMRCHEDCTYDVQGNWILDGSYQFDPVSREVIPQSNLTWGTIRPNIEVDSSGNFVRTIPIP